MGQPNRSLAGARSNIHYSCTYYIIQDNFLHVVDEPTRDQNTLDLVLTTNVDLLMENVVVGEPFSDHNSMYHLHPKECALHVWKKRWEEAILRVFRACKSVLSGFWWKIVVKQTVSQLFGMFWTCLKNSLETDKIHQKLWHLSKDNITLNQTHVWKQILNKGSNELLTLCMVYTVRISAGQRARVVDIRQSGRCFTW